MGTEIEMGGWKLSLLLYLCAAARVAGLPEHDDCGGNCFNAPTSSALNPIDDNTPLHHGISNWATRDRPSLSVDLMPIMVNEASTMKSAKDAPYSQTGWSSPCVGGGTSSGSPIGGGSCQSHAGVAVPPNAPPPPPQGALADPTFAYGQTEINCPAEHACNVETPGTGDTQTSDHCSKYSAFGGIMPTGCDALYLQSRLA